jgi:DNA polymerase-3 subunit beta
MKFVVQKTILLDCLKNTLGVVDLSRHMPILSHFLLEAKAEEAVLSATDLEVGLIRHLPTEASSSGAVAVPAKVLYGLVKEMREQIRISSDGTEIKIKSGSGTYRIKGLPADQFPPIPIPDDLEMVEVESRTLRDMIDKTIFSVSGDDFQYHLSGIYWETVKDSNPPNLRLVSSDGHRLSLIDRPVPGCDCLKAGVLVPRKGMVQMARLLSSHETVSLGLTKDNLVLKTDNGALLIRLSAKKFPDYRRIMSDSFACRFSIARQELFNTVKRISLLSTERFRGVKLTLGSDSLEATFQNPEVGEGREVLSLTLEEGDPGSLPLQIGFNARYLLEPLAVMDGDRVFLEINQPYSPVQLRSPDDPGALWIVMPMDL